MPKNVEKVKRLKSILTFSSDFESNLPTTFNSENSSSFAENLRNYLNTFPNKFSSSTYYEEIERRGIAIWNLCIRLRREIDSESSNDAHEILLLARVFAFFLLDCAHQCSKVTSKNLPRLMRAGVKTCKSCMEEKNSDMALKVLGKISGYQELIKNFGAEFTKDDRDVCEKLLVEYYILRTAVAWQMEQLDIAEHMYHKSTNPEHRLDASTTENLTDVLFEMGKELLNKKQYEMSIKWSRRAFDVINNWQLDELSNDASELRISIMQVLIKGLLCVQVDESFAEAQKLLDILEREVGDKLVVLLLHLEILSAPNNKKFDSSAYSDIILRIMRVVYLTEPNFNLLMFHVRKLNDKSPSLGCQIIEEILNKRVLVDGLIEFVEKILVTRIWMEVGHGDNDDRIQQLEKLLSNILANIKKPISSQATLAAQTLIWKKIESNYTTSQFDKAERWCKLAKHPIFEKSGELNMAKISRKLLLCALAKKEIGNAREIFFSMTEAARNEPLSRFLMYKIAIRSGDDDMAVECLHKISSATVNDPSLLYACCLDSQKIGNKPQLLVTLQLVLDKLRYETPSNCHLPSLLRLTIGLMIEMHDDAVKSGIGPELNIVKKLCESFESAASSISQGRGSNKSIDVVWTMDEHEWFSKNSYNLAIKNLSTWDPRQTLRLLQSCLVFINEQPLGINQQISDDLSLRKLFCEFTAATAMIALARTEDNIEIQLQQYLNIRKHVNSFEEVLQAKKEVMDVRAREDLNRKLSILIAFDFEAACRLKAWDDLENIISKAHTSNTGRIYEIMADCILCADIPAQALVATLKKIINEAWKSETLDTAKLAKYMRCLFQIAISENTELAEQLLDQVQSHAEEALETDQKYPTEELEWIAIRAFNHAVDLYCCHDDDRFIDWSSKSLNIAQYCIDNGALKRSLQNKLMKMKLDV
ncbi:Sporulation-specific protein 22 [Erysiphe neolycopersici]|uniref:Sporulation-specific protein 22 n=1 Tax=Erysiphe neolycopersici TaxID=212602 RepID=A0A420I1M6_9PEZI|nr:Sporulation-specific protein 22 [Erysiphe neolycopersici]